MVSAAPLLSQRAFVSAKVIAVESLSHNVKRVRFSLPKPYSFQAGQFALVRVPPSFVENWNARHHTKHAEIRRPYSFASSPARLPEAEFIIQLAAPPTDKQVPPGLASTYVHSHLKPGDALEVSEPMGNLNLPESATRPIVLVAGGTGVAPFMGLLDHWFRTKLNKRRKIYLFFGARQQRDLLLHAELSRWAAKKKNFEYIPALSDPAAADQWTGATGFINAVLDKHFAGTLDADVLIAGSPRMMQETVKVAKAKGIPAGQIRHDPIQVAP